MRTVVPVLALVVIRLFDATWRYRQTGRRHLDSCLGSGRPVSVAFLHGRILLLLPFLSRLSNVRWLAMCSTSADGDAMARIEESLGIEVSRGSSGRGGLQAIVDMIRRVRDDHRLNPCLAVDGSRGPRGRVKGGVISLAQRTGQQVLPIAASARPASIVTRAWDRTLLPWFFARVEIVYGEPLHVPAKLDGEQLESLRRELEERLVSLHARADELSGFADDEPLRAPEPR